MPRKGHGEAQDVSAGGQRRAHAEGKVPASGKHAHVACEAGHGRLARHAEDPAANVPKLPTVATLCVRCHEKDTAKPKTFPQVVSVEHSGGMACNNCHKPHNPHL